MADQQQDNEELKTEIEKVSRKYSETAEAINALTAFTFLNPAPLIPGRNDISELEWLRQRALLFAQFVQEVAEKTGADTLQLWDREKRTEEQTAQLKDAAAQFFFKHTRALYNSAFMSAVKTLKPIIGEYDDPGDYDMFSDGAPSPDKIDYEYVPVKQQAIIYYFATHDTIKPGDQTPLKKDQAFDLENIYRRLDALYYQTAGDPDEPDPIEILTEFIAIDCRRKWQEQSARQLSETQGIEVGEEEKMLLMQSITPEKHKIMDNALMNTMQKTHFIEKPEEAQGFPVLVRNERKRGSWTIPAIYSQITATYDPKQLGEEVTRISEYDRQVSDAVITLWLEAKRNNARPIFSLDAIYRALPGGGDHCSKKHKDAIIKSLEKLRRIHIYADLTDEMRSRKVIRDREKYIVDDYYFNFRVHTVKTRNGAVVTVGYELVSTPVIYTYCNLVDQIRTVPQKYLNIEKISVFKGKEITTGELLKMSPERIAIVGNLVRNIEEIRGGYERARDAKRKYDAKVKKNEAAGGKRLDDFMKSRRPVISFDTLFHEVGLDDIPRQYAAKYRAFIFDVLKYWKHCGNFLKDYVPIKKGNTITGVKIIT